MTYNEFIQNIIRSRGRFGLMEEYKERHYIQPRCIGGTNENDNLIELTAKEHFIAHKLLADENPDNYKLQYAYFMMGTIANNNMERYKLSSEEFENLRITKSKVLSNYFKGKPLSDQCKEKLSKSLTQYYQEHPFTNKQRECHKRLGEISKTEESRKLRGLKLKQYYETHEYSEVRKRKISAANKGKVRSSEQIDNMKKITKRLWENEEYRNKNIKSHMGYKQTEEHIRNAAITRHKKVKCVETGRIFDSYKEAAEWLNISPPSISKACHGIYNTVGGYHWEKINLKEEE